MNIKLHIESIIFSSNQPVKFEELREALPLAVGDEVHDEEIEQALTDIRTKYRFEEFPFQLVETGGGYQFLTKDAYHKSIATFQNQKVNKRLTAASLETLAIIAYKQPITKSEVENIRGVNCDYTIQKLLEKDLVAIVGRDTTPGKPLLYGTGETFMDYFGINSVADLPKLREISHHENEIGLKKAS